MPPISYLILITATRNDTEVMLAVLNIAGVAKTAYGAYGNDISKSLWVVPKGRKTQLEVVAELRLQPAICKASVVSLHNPVLESDLLDIRQLFSELGWDTIDVSDSDLSLYINAALQNRFDYYLDFEHQKSFCEVVKVSVKSVQEHPDFSADWVQTTIPLEEMIEDKIFTAEDFETEYECFEETIEFDDEELPPPPLNEPA